MCRPHGRNVWRDESWWSFAIQVRWILFCFSKKFLIFQWQPFGSVIKYVASSVYRIKKIIYIHATVELLESIMAQYLWYSWVVHRQELTSSTKTICKRVGSFFTETKNRCIQKITSQHISKIATIQQNWPHEFKWFNRIQEHFRNRIVYLSIIR